MFLDLQWKDPRVCFDPDKAGTDRKVFQEHEAALELERIWWPDVEIENAQSSRNTEHLELIISSDGTVEYEERFRAMMSAEFDLTRFPFDDQELELDMESFTWNTHAVSFVKNDRKIGYNSTFRLPEWTIETVEASVKTEKEIRSEMEFSEVIFTIHVKRLPGYYIWKILIPLFLIVFLSWSVFWMSGEPISGRMQRTFLALLTVVAFHRIVAEYLPRLSFLTFMDSIVLMAYIVVGMTVIENVIVYRLKEQGNELGAQAVDKTAQWLIPGSFIMLCILLLFIYLR